MSSDDIYDDNIFQQLLDMDDDNSTFEFTRSILDDFFIQMDESQQQFADLMAKKDFEEVSKLGHKCKGSSGQVSLVRVRDICDAIQHYKMKTKPGNEEQYLQDLIDQLPEAVQEGKDALYSRIQ